MKRFFASLLVTLSFMVVSAQNTKDDLDRFNELVKKEPVRGEDKGANPKFHQLLVLSKKLNFPIKERYYTAQIMRDHSANSKKDSCLFYLQKLKEMVEDAKNEMSVEEEIKNYNWIASTESSFFGYNFNVTNYYSKAYELALTSKNENAIFYVIIGIAELIILQEGAQLDQVNQVLQDIKSALNDYPNTYYRFDAYNTLARLYFLKDDLDEAKHWIDISMKGTLEDKYHTYQYWIAENLLSYFFYKKGEVYKALDVLNSAMNEFEPLSGNQDELKMMYYHYFLYYNYIGDDNKALSYITKASEAPLSIYEKIYYKDKMVRYLYDQGSFKLAEKINEEKLKLLSEITISDNKMISNFFINEIQKKDLEVAQQSLINKNLKLTKQNANTKTQLILLIIGLIISLFLLILYTSQKKIKKKDETIIDLRNRETQILRDLVKERENELQLIALKLANRMKDLKELKETIGSIKMITPAMNTLKTKINQLITSGSEVSEVSDRLQTQYPDVSFNLKELHPDLSETEIKYCLLTKLNLSLKETADILMVSPDTVKHTRSRIKRKMNISKEITLSDYMNQISDQGRVVA